ncbi:eCIS core domain-containing protein [Calothrix sp. NIES-2100]|uniref:eCIS core domain-containing protein n=1 Tax=Calothrix sp. NIES-2100 TaxID=1954172 RepID=UPI0030D7C756
MELEADRIADQVMRMPEPAIQRQMELEDEEEGMIQREIASQITPLVQRQVSPQVAAEDVIQTKATGNQTTAPASTQESSEAPYSVHQALSSPGQPLDAATRAFMEPRFGHDFSRVRVHSGEAAERSAWDVKAHAYTVGHNIVFGTSQFVPGSTTGRQLLAHELAHAIQQSGSPPATWSSASQVLRPTSTTLVQRQETGSGLDDPLYMADRRWSSGQGPDDRITGYKLQNWAIARASFVIQDDRSLMRMQEQDGAESDIVDEIAILLTDLLRGHNPLDPDAPEYIRMGSEKHLRPMFEQTSLDKFEGSVNAREMAVMELMDHWGPIKDYLTHALITRYRDSYLEAAGRTPQNMSLTDDSKEIKRIRTKDLYQHEHRIHQGLVGDIIFRVGQRYGRFHIADIYKTLGTGSDSGGIVWVYLDGYPLWYYSGSVDLLNRQTVIGEVMRETAEAAKFAAQLFPLLIKAGGFVLSFSPSPLIMIAGVVLDDLGEEGLRDLSGEGRSFKDIASSAGREILVNLVIGKLMGGGEGKATSEAAETLDKVAEKAATKIRASVEQEIARTEGPQVVRAVEAGEVRGVTDKALVDEGFVYEMEIKHDGGSHIYRRKLNGKICRWSTHRICDLTALEEELEHLGGFQEGFEGPLGDIVADPKEAGSLFNKLKIPKGAHAEVQLRTPSGRYPRVDLYIKGEKIISRKFPMGQLANDELKALDYLQELYVKYPPKAPIRSADLKGEVLEGVQVLQVPVQYVLPLPEIVLKYARDRNIIICDIEGKIYNL